MKRLLFVSLVAASLLHGYDRPYEFGASVGVTSVENEDSIKLSNPTFGLHFQMNVSKIKPRFDIEYTTLDIDDNEPDSLLRTSINGVYEFYDDGRHYLMPYMLVGGGYERVGHDRDNFESLPFMQGGVGLKYLARNNNIAATLEVKALQIIGGDKEEKNEGIVTLGFSIPFGNFPKPAVIAPPPAPIVVPMEIIDSDGDGVMDRLDKCPNTPMGVSVDGAGCPLPVTPAPVQLSLDNNECPVKIDGADRDRDGVVDAVDQCPNTPCDFSVDSKGCPVKATLRIHFQTAKAYITDYSRPKVERFAQFLLNNKGSHVHIVGHTDWRGSDNYNMILSKQRAESVKNALIEYGVSPSRITSNGKGESEPIADNRTEEGMALNRRIEVTLTYPNEVRTDRGVE